MLHQLMKKMELAGSTGTLKLMPKAILRSCCRVPAARGESSGCFRQLGARSRLPGTAGNVEEGPHAAPHTGTICMQETKSFFNSGH